MHGRTKVQVGPAEAWEEPRSATKRLVVSLAQHVHPSALGGNALTIYALDVGQTSVSLLALIGIGEYMNLWPRFCIYMWCPLYVEDIVLVAS